MPKQDRPLLVFLSFFNFFENFSDLFPEIKILSDESFITYLVIHKLLFLAITNQITLFLSQKLCCWYLKMVVLYISKLEEWNISKISSFSHFLQNIIDRRHSMNSLEILTDEWIYFFKCCTYTERNSSQP